MAGCNNNLQEQKERFKISGSRFRHKVLQNESHFAILLESAIKKLLLI